nr:MAG TPA: minor capsid protein [Caudoviricetes sp.]
MLTADEIESLPIGLEKQFRQLEKRIMRDIIRRLKNAEEITRTADWQIYRAAELGKAADDIKKEIAEALDATEDEVNRIYTDAAKTDWTRSKKLYKSVGQAAIAYKDNEPLKQLVVAIKKQTADELKNITRALGVATANKGKIKTVSLTEYYTDMLDAAVLDISSGAFDYNTVLQHTVTQLANSGIRTIDYDSVSKRPTSARIDVAVRRAVMTGIGQLTAQVSEDNANALGTDMYEVSAHSCCRPEHVEWQGGWYTMAQLKSVCGYGKVDGLKGANCGHDFYPVIPGVSEPSYTAEELRQMKADEAEKHEYKGKEYTKYEASQKQRRLERTVAARYHAVDLLKEGGADEKTIQDAKISYQAVSQEYTRFSRAMGLTPQRERINLALGGMEGRSNPAPAPVQTDANPVEIPLDKSEKSGIIIDTEMYRRKDYKPRENVKPVSAKTFNDLTIGAKKDGAEIIRCEYGDSFYRHLEENNATASCIGDILIFRPDATVSEVLEETYHFQQNQKGINADKEIILRAILNEIDAKKFILRNAKKYGVPRAEIDEIASHLEQYTKELEEYYKKGKG